MDLTTELASGFPVSRYLELRGRLEGAHSDDAAWVEVVAAVRRRLDERFLGPIATLASTGRRDGLVPGFAILALDCLLIDTLQAFREGRVTTGENTTAKSFRTFLKGPRFSCFSGNDRWGFQDVRNGLLHNGETRGDWKVRVDTPEMLTKVAGAKTRILNRRLFHEAIQAEVGEYVRDLSTGAPHLREAFLQRMDALSGLVLPASGQPIEWEAAETYFAYGSNLAEREMLAKAPNARAEGIAFLPGHRLVFNKHSVTRRCDAASIETSACSMVWGFLYSVPPEDAVELARREGGYAKREMTAWRVTGGGDAQPVEVFTFVAKARCPDGCGPTEDYLRLIVDGATARGLPGDYIDAVVGAPAVKGTRGGR